MDHKQHLKAIALAGSGVSNLAYGNWYNAISTLQAALDILHEALDEDAQHDSKIELCGSGNKQSAQHD